MPNDDAYPRYGGRGISICERWLGKDGFANFLADMGEAPPDREIDRIDNDKGYSPENCRWATIVEQANNKRNTRRATYRGELLPLSEIQARSGLKYATVYYRAVVSPRGDVAEKRSANGRY